MERRGRIPVAKFRTQEGKTRSRSRVREPDYNEQDPETDLFTLLEDNIALKEENKLLKKEMEDNKQICDKLTEENVRMRKELDIFKVKQKGLEMDMEALDERYNRDLKERMNLEKLQRQNMEKIKILHTELERKSLEKLQATATTTPVIIDSVELKNKLLKILPGLSNNEMASLLEVDGEKSAMPVINTELVECLVDEFMLLKNSFAGVELQLYEANEKISELLENQHHLEEDNNTLRTENMNLTKVAKLLTENMRESVETSKKMEAALIKLKQRNDELKARDIPDGQTEPNSPIDPLGDGKELEKVQEQVENQNREQGERIVEMKSLMEAALKQNTNDELKALQLKLQILEQELQTALTRAEKAEAVLLAYQKEYETSKQSDLDAKVDTLAINKPPTPPPAPPPPPKLLYTPNSSLQLKKKARPHEDSNIAAKVPGVLKTEGIDAVVRELKCGRVTLRRNRRKTHTTEALQEMFQVLEISQTQNRNSKICMDLHL